MACKVELGGGGGDVNSHLLNRKRGRGVEVVGTEYEPGRSFFMYLLGHVHEMFDSLHTVPVSQLSDPTKRSMLHSPDVVDLPSCASANSVTHSEPSSRLLSVGHSESVQSKFSLCCGFLNLYHLAPPGKLQTGRGWGKAND